METNHDEKAMIVPQISISLPQPESGNAKNALKNPEKKKKKGTRTAAMLFSSMQDVYCRSNSTQSPNPELLYHVLPFLLVTVGCALLSAEEDVGLLGGCSVTGLIKHQV